MPAAERSSLGLRGMGALGGAAALLMLTSSAAGGARPGAAAQDRTVRSTQDRAGGQASPTPDGAEAPGRGVLVLRNDDILPGTALRAQTADHDYSLTLHDGEERYEIRADDRWVNDSGKGWRRRSELSGLTAPAGGYQAFSYDLLVEPQSFAVQAQYVFGQLHKGRRDLGDAAGEHPIVAFRLLPGGRPSLTVSGSDAKPLIRVPKSVEVWRGQASEFALGRWHHVEVRLMLSRPEPWCELWLDGVREVHATGRIGYANAAPPYWKRGVYDAQRSDERVVARYRNVRLVTGETPP